MSSRYTNSKWLGILIVVTIILSLIVSSRPAAAQEEIPPTATESPSDDGFIPTIMPTPTGTESFPPIQPQDMEQPQFTQRMNAPLGTSWQEFNISQTGSVSEDPSIAVDAAGGLHIVWSEAEANGVTDVYYTFWDGQTLSKVNVSTSETFDSTVPQIATDNTGRAHIVWDEESPDGSHPEGDVDVMYSRCTDGICTLPVKVSGPPDIACGGYSQPGNDWLSGAATIAVDQDNNIMVVWRAYEYSYQITQVYSTWNASSAPPSPPTGCAPFGGSITEQWRLVEHHRVAGGGAGDFRLVFVSRLMGSTAQVFYTQFSNGSWTTPVLVATKENPYPDIFLDSSGQAHITVCSADGKLQYWNSGSQTAQDIPYATCYRDAPIIMDALGTLHVLWEQDLQIHISKNTSEGWSYQGLLIESGGVFRVRPDAVADPNGNLHAVWQDFRDGIFEAYYTSLYTCENIELVTDAGKAVLSVIEGTHPNYCKNQVEGVITVPDIENEGAGEAFQEWSDLASSAKHEVAFTVMFWDERDPDKDKKSVPYPGEIVLQGVASLYSKVKDLGNAEQYPHGMTVRILLGVQCQTEDQGCETDQRRSVLTELKKQTIPVYELLDDGRIWKVEVGLYRDGGGVADYGSDTNKYSHVKLLVVDNNKMIVSGYHPQYDMGEIDNKDHDLGLKVSGPIAANGMAVFDSLWIDSQILCTEEDDILQISNWNNCHTAIGSFSHHMPFIPAGDDIALPLYRDSIDKTADAAVQAAIEAGQTNVFVLQNRVGVPFPPYSLAYYKEEGWLPYANALLTAANNADVHILLSGNDFNYWYNAYSAAGFYREYFLSGNPHQSFNDLIRVYKPAGLLSDAPELHAKSFLVDGEFLVVGSQNFDHSAFGNNPDDLDLVEFSLGIEDLDAVSYMAGKLAEWWDNSGTAFLTMAGESLESGVQQASAGDVVLVESGTYEITSTLNVPEGVTLSGLNVIIKPAANFTGQALVRVNGSNTHLSGFTIDSGNGYGIEIGDSTTALEDVKVSNVVFINNELGGIHIQSPADGSAISYTIENNTFVGDDYGITISTNANSTGVIRNNIFAGQNIAPIHIASANDGTVEYAYNLFYDCNGGDCSPNNWKIGNLGANSTEHDNLFDLNPLFANPANGDYRLSINSPAVDTGDPSILHEFLIDGDGDGIPNLDLGAFEYVDTGSPAVQSITRGSADPTNAEGVDFTVTFSEPVENVDIGDFALATSGVSDAFIDNVDGSEAVYTVWVNTGTGDGTIRLDISDATDIADPAGNPLIGVPYTDGETYTIAKTIPPTPTPAPPTPTPTPPPGNEIVIDEFDGPQLDSNWEWYVPQAGPTYSLTEVPGSFQMSLPAGQYYEHWVGEDFAPQLRRTDMGNGDWAIEARLEAITAAPNAGYWAALEVGFDQYDQIWFGMVDDGYLRNFMLGDLSSSFEYFESLPVTLRLEKDGEDYTFYHKIDGDADWTFLSTQSYSRPPVYVGLIGRSWDTGSSDLKMDWSYFKLERISVPDNGPQDVVLTVLNTNDIPQEGLNTYVFNGATYMGVHGQTDENGQVTFNLPTGDYRFRADLNGTHFWSDSANHCHVPDCDDAAITVTEPVTISVRNSSDEPQIGLKVYAFDETTYTGYNVTTNEYGEAVFTLPLGSYRFRADLNGTQFWSSEYNHCHLPGCESENIDISITIPFLVTVRNTDDLPQAGLKVYAFDDTTYTGYNGTTDENGEAVFTLPFGSYRFRADLNSTQFWSGAGNHCDLPGCGGVNIQVTKPMVVTVLNTDDTPQEGLRVYAFDGTSYTGYNALTNSNGQASFTLPVGSYRFRADLNSTQFWSGTVNHCDIPDCGNAQVTVTIPIIVTVQDTEGAEKEGVTVYAFNGTTYVGYSKTTNASGQATFTLPLGNYRFRADYNGTQFWSGTVNHCSLPGCANAQVTVTNVLLVSVQDTDGLPRPGLKVYAFNGSTYTGYNATTDANGQVAFTLPQGSYRFRADLNGTQFWSGTSNHCDIPGCGSADITVTKPIVVNVSNTDNAPQAGLKVYAFNGTTYTGYNATTNASGQVTFTLPQGSYRFRADLNNTQFWSGASNHCALPGCDSAGITVTIPVTVTVQDGNGFPKSGIKVYVFNGATYTGYNQVTNANGQVVFTLPVGNYRFRADYNNVQFWSETANHCALPGCLTAAVSVSP